MMPGRLFRLGVLFSSDRFCVCQRVLQCVSSWTDPVRLTGRLNPRMNLLQCVCDIVCSETDLCDATSDTCSKDRPEIKPKNGTGQNRTDPTVSPACTGAVDTLMSSYTQPKNGTGRKRTELDCHSHTPSVAFRHRMS